MKINQNLTKLAKNMEKEDFYQRLEWAANPNAGKISTPFILLLQAL